jgi:hypothetical protein
MAHAVRDRPRRRVAPSIQLVLLGLVPWLAGACTVVPPQPWQKGALARPEMTMGADTLEQRYSRQIYASKENSGSGAGIGGGGCGCN